MNLPFSVLQINDLTYHKLMIVIVIIYLKQRKTLPNPQQTFTAKLLPMLGTQK